MIFLKRIWLRENNSLKNEYIFDIFIVKILGPVQDRSSVFLGKKTLGPVLSKSQDRPHPISNLSDSSCKMNHDKMIRYH